MDRATDGRQRQAIAAHSLRHHTILYERFFVLCIDLKVNGDNTKLSGVDSRRMLLSAPKRGSWQITSEHLLGSVNEAGKKHGIGQLGRLRCGQLPMLQCDHDACFG